MAEWPANLISLQGRHNERDCVSNNQPHDCLLNRLFRRRSKKTSKFRVTGFCEGNSPVTGEFPAQMASNAENDSIRWHHHLLNIYSIFSHVLFRPSPSYIVLLYLNLLWLYTSSNLLFIDIPQGFLIFSSYVFPSAFDRALKDVGKLSGFSSKRQCNQYEPCA